MKTIKVKEREGFWWSVLAWIVLLTVCPILIILYWVGKGFTVLSDLLRELAYRVFYEPINHDKWSEPLDEN